MSLAHPSKRTVIDHLPQEVIDDFIEILSLGIDHDQTRRDLISCNQVSRVFRPQARKCLFSEVLLVVRPGSDDCNKSTGLRRLLEEDDGLAHLIRTFVLKIDVGSHSIPHQQLLDKNLPSIFNKISCLRKFSLDMTNAAVCGWPGFDNSIKSGFLDLLTRQLDTLELIGSDGAKFPSDLVTKWTSIKKLKVVGSPIDSSDASLEYIPAAVAQQEAVAHLENLELNKLFCVDFLQDAMIHGLKSLKAVIESDSDVLNTWSILRESCNSLESLVLHDALASFNSAPAEHDMSDLCFPNLRHVEIREPHLNIRLDSVNMLSKVLVVLASGEFVASMSLAFKFRVGAHDINHSYEEECMDPKSWSELDKALAAARYFRKLDVELTFYYGLKVPRRATVRDSVLKAKQSWISRNIFPKLSANSNSTIHLSATMI